MTTNFTFCTTNSIKQRGQVLEQLANSSSYTIRWATGTLPNQLSLPNGYIMLFLIPATYSNVDLCLYASANDYRPGPGDRQVSVEEFLEFAGCFNEGIYKK